MYKKFNYLTLLIIHTVTLDITLIVMCDQVWAVIFFGVVLPTLLRLHQNAIVSTSDRESGGLVSWLR